MKTNILDNITPQKNKRGYWVVNLPKSVGGKRQRFYFTDRGEALRRTAEIVLSIKTGQQEAGTPIPIDSASPSSISARASVFLSESSERVDALTRHQLRWALKILCEKFGNLPPERITPEIVDSFLSVQKLSTRSKFNLFACCRTFFNTRSMRQAVPVNPFDKAPPKSDKGKRIEILTPEQMRKLVEADFPSWFKRWIVCGGFAGLRTAEQQRLSFDAFDFEFNEIIVRKEQSKQGEAARPRSITMQPVFIRHFVKGEGMILEGKSAGAFRDFMPTALEVLGLKKWPKNCLRHGFASYTLAANRDAVRTAFELGHTSPTLLYAVYGNSVSRKDAAEYFAI